MASHHIFDFSVDKEKQSVFVKREFKAPISMVWSAWTEPEILDRWWAPKPWKSKTKSMDFKVGGRRLYAMVGPEGEEHWALAEFESITPKSNFKFLDGFCDKQGNINNELPRSDWNVDFIEQDGSTIVNITIQHESHSDLERILEMGFKEGFTMALQNLDEILEKE